MQEKFHSERYQLIKLADEDLREGRWDDERRTVVLDLRSLRPMLEANPGIPESARRLLAGLTENYTRPYELRNTLHRDDTVYYSNYWKRKDSILTIAEYKRSGFSDGLTAYLGPLSNIPTGSYGTARFEVHYKGETLSFWGVALKTVWSLFPNYWAAAEVYLPEEDNAIKADVAIISQHLPVNYLDDKAIYLLMPKSR